MPEHSLPDMWDIADDGETAVETGADEDGLEYLLEVRPEEGLLGTSFSGLYIERDEDPGQYNVAIAEGSTDGFLAGGRVQGRVFEYETATDDPDLLRAEIQQAYLEDVTRETTALLEAMLNTDAGVERDPLTALQMDSFVATRREDLEQVYDETF